MAKNNEKLKAGVAEELVAIDEEDNQLAWKPEGITVVQVTTALIYYPCLAALLVKASLTRCARLDNSLPHLSRRSLFQ